MYSEIWETPTFELAFETLDEWRNILNIYEKKLSSKRYKISESSDKFNDLCYRLLRQYTGLLFSVSTESPTIAKARELYKSYEEKNEVHAELLDLMKKYKKQTGYEEKNSILTLITQNIEFIQGRMEILNEKIGKKRKSYIEGILKKLKNNENLGMLEILFLIDNYEVQRYLVKLTENEYYIEMISIVDLGDNLYYRINWYKSIRENLNDWYDEHLEQVQKSLETNFCFKPVQQ